MEALNFSDSALSLYKPKDATHIVGLQIRVVLLEAVVEDCYDNPFASVAHLPGGHHI